MKKKNLHNVHFTNSISEKEQYSKYHVDVSIGHFLIFSWTNHRINSFNFVDYYLNIICLKIHMSMYYFGSYNLHKYTPIIFFFGGGNYACYVLSRFTTKSQYILLISKDRHQLLLSIMNNSYL
jgi:hypothetical protein